MSVAQLENVRSMPRGSAGAPAWALVSAGAFVVMMACGNGLLNDSDTLWQIAVGQSIIDHGAMPYADIYSFTRAGAPWRSSSWLSQVLYAQAYALGGWGGVVALAAAAIAAATGLLVRALGRYVAPVYAAVIALGALALSMPHLLARPHVLVMPVMVLWVAELSKAGEAGRAPSPLLLVLIALWANLHGSFVFGIAIAGAFGLDALWNAPAAQRGRLVLQWAAFGFGALLAACMTPYGWGSFIAASQILGLGGLLNIISEWRPADFGHPGLFEITVLGLIVGLLCSNISFAWPRALIVLGLVGMALAHRRNIELLALLVPLVVAARLVARFPVIAVDTQAPRKSASPVMLALLVALCAGVGATAAYALRFTPFAAQPLAAVDALKQHHATRVLNDLPFGGYLIWRKVPVFVDGRAELYGEEFDTNYLRALELRDVDRFLALLSDNNIDATLLAPATPAVTLLDRLPGWKRVHADGVAVVHVRDPSRTSGEVQP